MEFIIPWNITVPKGTNLLSAYFLRGISHVKIEEQWLTGDVRPGRESEQWLNLILRKV